MWGLVTVWGWVCESRVLCGGIEEQSLSGIMWPERLMTVGGLVSGCAKRNVTWLWGAVTEVTMWGVVERGEWQCESGTLRDREERWRWQWAFWKVAVRERNVTWLWGAVTAVTTWGVVEGKSGSARAERYVTVKSGDGHNLHGGGCASADRSGVTWLQWKVTDLWRCRFRGGEPRQRAA